MYELLQTERFGQWLRGIKDSATRGRVNAHLACIRAHGPYCGDWKRVGGGVVEQRIHAGPGLRVYLAVGVRSVVLLLVGGDKSTQTRDIAAAKRLAKAWREGQHREAH